jgi:DNA-binding MarR family transcriptional regulator
MDKDKHLLFENQLCFLFYTVSRGLTRLYTPLLAPLGLTYLQYLVMLLLWERDSREVGSLTESLMMDTGTVSPLLKRMERSGLLNRSRSAEDERKVLITLTTKGVQLKKKATDIPEKLFCMMKLGMEEYYGLKETLEGLIPRITKSDP